MGGFGTWPGGAFAPRSSGALRAPAPPPPPTLFEQVLALTQGRPLFTADYYAIDSVSGKVAAFVDWNDPAHLLMQASAARQVALPAPHADFAGAPAVAFDGVHLYASTRPGSQWSMLHDGLSSEVFCAFTLVDTATAIVYGTRVGGTGAQVHFGAGKMVHYLQTHGAQTIPNVAFGSLATYVASYTSVRHLGAAYELRQRDRLHAMGAFAPTGEPSETPLQLGGAQNLQFLAKMRWAAWGAFPALDAGQRAIVAAWLAEAYGLRTAEMLFESVKTLTQGRPLFTADYYAIDTVSGKVAAFVDHNDPAHLMAQPTSARQVPIPQPEPTVANAIVASAAGGQIYESNRHKSLWNFAADCVSSESLRVFRKTNPALGVLDSSIVNVGDAGQEVYASGSLINASVLSAAGTLAQMSAGSVVLNETTFAIMRLEQAGNPQYEVRQPGRRIAASAFAVAPGVAASYPTTILARRGLAYPFIGQWAALGHFPALTSAERLKIEAWTQVAHGVKTAALLFEQVKALAAGRPVFTADYYAIDGVTGNVAGFVDHNDPAHQLRQTISGRQVAIPAASSSFAGAAVATFAGAQAAYTSTRTAAAWTFSNDGVDCQAYQVFRAYGADAVQYMFLTDVNAGLGTVIFQYANNLFNFLWRRPGATIGNFGYARSTTATYLSQRTKGDAVPQLVGKQRGAVTASVAYGGTPGTAPQAPFMVGAQSATSPTNPAVMEWRACWFGPALAPDQESTLQAWIQQDTGIAP